jgi:hypothetical protein
LVSPVPSASAISNIVASASSPLAPIGNKPPKAPAKPAASRKAPGSENHSPLAKTGAGKGLKGDEEPGGKAKPLPDGVKGRKGAKVASGVTAEGAKVASGVTAAGAIETHVPPAKKRGRPRKEHGTEDKDGGNGDNVLPRKRVRRSDDLAVAEADQVTGPRVRVRTEKGQAQGGPTRK